MRGRVDNDEIKLGVNKVNLTIVLKGVIGRKLGRRIDWRDGTTRMVHSVCWWD